MSKFNTARAPAATSPVRGEATPSTVTHQGGAGYARNARSELFLLAVTNMVGEDTFYESAGNRNTRFADLIRRSTLDDPQWTARFLRWLRTDANLRTAALVGAAEFAKARRDAGLDGLSRQVVASVLQRADEPGELLGYWTSVHGRAVPKPVKRGIADAVEKLYDERSFVKWDSAARAFRFADVLELTHPVKRDDAQGALFRHILDERHDRGNAVPEPLGTLRMRAELLSWDVGRRRELFSRPGAAGVLRAAGMTWESVAGWLQGPLDARVWEALIPSMGYMACLAEGTPIWLADGTTAPIEEVVRRRLPVLSYDRAWDTRPVRYGPGQEPRERSVGRLVPTVPSDWIDAGLRPASTVRLASGREITATQDHRWVRQRAHGRRAWEWTTTAELVVGDRIPAPLTASYFGTEGDAWDGYFVGAMLGDGGMTSVTPEFHGDPEDGACAFMRDYAAKHGCEVREYPNGKIVRMRFPLKQWQRNPLAEVLRAYGVWGKRVEVKALPERPFSREFWIGTLSGLIDTDGCVRERRNAKQTYHASVEYGTVSRRLATQVADALLRLGVPSRIVERAPRTSTGRIAGREVVSRRPLFLVEVSRAAAIRRLAEVLDLRVGYKAATLARAAERLAHVTPAAGEMHGYDPSVVLDRVVAIEDSGEVPSYCVTVDPSHLFVANGVVTGNCLRNLRNFDEAGVSDAVARQVAERLADPAQVAKSRQLPMRFLSAYRAAPSLRWAWALEQAVSHALANVPALGGRTLILVDTSASMNMGFSRDGSLMRWDAAAVFGLALGRRCADADVVSFSDKLLGGARTKVFKLRPGGSLLSDVERWKSGGFFLGGGTNTSGALRKHFAKHDRVVILTDEQAGWGDVGQALPAHVPLYTWNLAGYRFGHAPSGSAHRHTFGGLTDQGFRMIPLLERGKNADWPF